RVPYGSSRRSTFPSVRWLQIGNRATGRGSSLTCSDSRLETRERSTRRGALGRKPRRIRRRLRFRDSTRRACRTPPGKLEAGGPVPLSSRQNQNLTHHRCAFLVRPHCHG